MKRSRSNQKDKKEHQPRKRQNTAKQGGLKFTRPEKTDFSPLYKKHRVDMVKVGCDVDAMVAVRRKIHAHPEGGFQEVQTRQTLIDTLVGFGVESKFIKQVAKTGLIVDICGSGKKSSSKEGKVKTVALRADMDGLPMPENNKSLPYVSQTSHAHMCGHDGHMACLLAAASVLWKHRSSIPSDQKVRLLF